MAKHSRIPPEPAGGRTTAPILADHALVPVAPRQDGWTPERQRAFIEVLADTGCIEAAAQSVGMTRQSAWRLRRRADARAFDAAWEAALERFMQQLLPVALDRAINGTVRQRWYHGELVAQERVYHDGLLRHLLENGAKMLSAAREREALRQDWEGGLDALEHGGSVIAENAPKWEVWRDPNGFWITDAPAPPGFKGYKGTWGHRDYFRELTDEEEDAQNARQTRIDAKTKSTLNRFFNRP